VTVVESDGVTYAPRAQDVIMASAGATHPLPAWLDSLRPDGRLLFPLTSEQRGGVMLLVTRGDDPLRMAARAVCRAWFTPFVGARDPALDARLAARMQEDQADQARSLRLDTHVLDESCWLHGDGFCLSWREPSGAGRTQPSFVRPLHGTPGP
jgi:protein-L-isoaspartate(D-aspartate) O-methyltransferase